MSFSLIPALKSAGRHRSKTPAQLRRELDEATCHLVALATEIDELRAERNQLEQQLDAAGIELSGARHDLRIADQERKRLEAALTAWECQWVNEHPIHVPAPRDLRGDDERDTVPTDVSSLRPIVPVVPIPQRPTYPITEHPAAPDATNPAHIPAA